MEETGTPSKINLQYAEEKVRFSFCDCSLDRKYSFWCLDSKLEAEKLLYRLKHIEKLKWKEWSSLARDNGLTKEKPGNPNFDLIHSQSTYEGNIIEQYYFHFRVEQADKYRVFGYQLEQFFCITHIDPKGRINH